MYEVGDKALNRQELIDFYAKLIDDFPIYSIEDGMSEDDVQGWQMLTSQLGSKVQLVGDDIFVTNKKRIQVICEALIVYVHEEL